MRGFLKHGRNWTCNCRRRWLPFSWVRVSFRVQFGTIVIINTGGTLALHFKSHIFLFLGHRHIMNTHFFSYCSDSAATQICVAFHFFLKINNSPLLFLTLFRMA